MSNYLKHKPGSLEELVSKQGSYREDSGYQKMFKKELDKAGKGIGSMSPAEKRHSSIRLIPSIMRKMNRIKTWFQQKKMTTKRSQLKNRP